MMWDAISSVILLILASTVAVIVFVFIFWILSHIQARAWVNVFEEYLNKKHIKFKNNEEDERKK